MGEAALVESRVADAIDLLNKLDSIGSPPTLAVWYFYDDAFEWRLLLAGPVFDALLPKQEAVAYRNVVDAIADITLSGLSLSVVKLVSTQAPLAKAIRVLIKTPPNGIVKAHFENTTLNGIFIKEMIVFEIRIISLPRHWITSGI